MNDDSVSHDDVFHVASLARIALSDSEADSLTKDLNRILGYVQQLDSVDVAGLEPTYQVTGLTNATRPDEAPDDDVDQAGLLKNAPSIQDDQIKVPKVL